MANIFGHLNIKDTDRVYESTIGVEVFWDECQKYIARVNSEVNAQMSLLVQSVTENYSERFKLPGGGYLQRRGSDGRYGAIKRTGEWDVGYPLEDLGVQVAWNDIDFRYLTAEELSNSIQTVALQNMNTLRWEVLHRVLDNVQWGFVDPLHGTVNVEPLANGDAVVYPPVIGSETEATEDHYLVSGYASASISATNDPLITLRNDLEHHFGYEVGNSNIFVFVNPTDYTNISGGSLSEFVPLSDRFVQEGDDTARPINWPNYVPGRPMARASGVWVMEWVWMPANYMLAIHGDAPAPLKKRVDPGFTGIPQGLNLVAKNEEFPFEGSFFRHRFGFGAGNRLNGAVMFLDTGSTYTVPTAYD